MREGGRIILWAGLWCGGVIRGGGKQRLFWNTKIRRALCFFNDTMTKAEKLTIFEFFST